MIMGCRLGGQVENMWFNDSDVDGTEHMQEAASP